MTVLNLCLPSLVVHFQKIIWIFQKVGCVWRGVWCKLKHLSWEGYGYFLEHIFIITQPKENDVLYHKFFAFERFVQLCMYVIVHDYVDCSLFQAIHGLFSILTQAVAFLPKTVCNIKEVEFARAVKLNKTSIELIMFQVPRVKASILHYTIANSVSRQDKPNPAL